VLVSLPLEALKDYIHVIGWGTIVSFVVWLWRKSIQISVDYTESRKAGNVAISQINDMATNHFPHMQKDLEELNTKTDDGNKSLTQIAQGMAVLVDRGR
jgi:hypothetical protein